MKEAQLRSKVKWEASKKRFGGKGPDPECSRPSKKIIEQKILDADGIQSLVHHFESLMPWDTS